MFSTCSEHTPHAPIPDGRMEQIMQPCSEMWSDFPIFQSFDSSVKSRGDSPPPPVALTTCLRSQWECNGRYWTWEQTSCLCSHHHLQIFLWEKRKVVENMHVLNCLLGYLCLVHLCAKWGNSEMQLKRGNCLCMPAWLTNDPLEWSLFKILKLPFIFSKLRSLCSICPFWHSVKFRISIHIFNIYCSLSFPVLWLPYFLQCIVLKHLGSNFHLEYGAHY